MAWAWALHSGLQAGMPWYSLPMLPGPHVVKRSPPQRLAALGGSRSILFEAAIQTYKFLANLTYLVLSPVHWQNDYNEN